MTIRVNTRQTNLLALFVSVAALSAQSHAAPIVVQPGGAAAYKYIPATAGGSGTPAPSPTPTPPSPPPAPTPTPPSPPPPPPSPPPSPPPAPSAGTLVVNKLSDTVSYTGYSFNASVSGAVACGSTCTTRTYTGLGAVTLTASRPTNWTDASDTALSGCTGTRTCVVNLTTGVTTTVRARAACFEGDLLSLANVTCTTQASRNGNLFVFSNETSTGRYIGFSEGRHMISNGSIFSARAWGANSNNANLPDLAAYPSTTPPTTAEITTLTALGGTAANAASVACSNTQPTTRFRLPYGSELTQINIYKGQLGFANSTIWTGVEAPESGGIFSKRQNAWQFNLANAATATANKTATASVTCITTIIDSGYVPPANCSTASVNWTVGANSCSATVPATNHLSSVTGTDTTKGSSSQEFQCNNGTFTPSNVGTCYANCLQTPTSWTGSGVNCNGIVPEFRHGETRVVPDNSRENSSRSFTCNDGTLTPVGVLTCEPRTCNPGRVWVHGPKETQGSSCSNRPIQGDPTPSPTIARLAHMESRVVVDYQDSNSSGTVNCNDGEATMMSGYICAKPAQYRDCVGYTATLRSTSGPPVSCSIQYSNSPHQTVQYLAPNISPTHQGSISGAVRCVDGSFFIENDPLECALMGP